MIECFAIIGKDGRVGACYPTLKQAVVHAKSWPHEGLGIAHMREVEDASPLTPHGEALRSLGEGAARG